MVIKIMNFGVKIKNHGEIQSEIFYHYKGAVLIKKGEGDHQK